jgi:hypothetical protein
MRAKWVLVTGLLEEPSGVNVMSSQVWVWIVLIVIAGAVLGYLALRFRARGSGPPEAGAAEALAPPPAPPTAPGGPPTTEARADEPGSESAMVSPGPYRGSALPTADGSFPSKEFTIKADDTLKRYLSPGSPYYLYARADLWFRSSADAEAAGFTPWDPGTG